MRQVLLLLAACTLLAGCASTEFTPWFGDAIQQGTGGTRRVVNGIDVWENGTPPMRYRIIGIIDDSRDDVTFTELTSDVTKKAADAGADAVIFLDSQRIRTGSTITPSTTTVKASGDTLYATSTPGYISDSYQKDSKWQAIKYLQ